jgi:hypothetical protein
MIAGGIYLYGYAERYPLVASQPTTSPVVGLVVAAFGLFVVGMGVYVQYVAAPEAPQMRDGEHVVEDRNPAQRNALAEALVAVPLLGLGGYLLYFTQRPLYQPTIVFGTGLFLFSRGLYRYWQNTLTTYLLTNQRVVEEYRFVSLLRNEVPLEKVRGVEEHRSAWDSLFGLGNVAVRSGSSSGLTVSVDEVYEPTEFADLVRAQLRSDVDDGVGTGLEDGTAGGETARSDGQSGTDAEPATAGESTGRTGTGRGRPDRRDRDRTATDRPATDSDRSVDAGTDVGRPDSVGPNTERRAPAGTDHQEDGSGDGHAETDPPVDGDDWTE